MVQRGKDPGRGMWGFPGGHVEPGETARAAAIRELREETNVTAAAIDYLTCVDVITDTHHYLIAAVVCRYLKGTPLAGDDAADARWFTPQELDALGPKLLPNAANLARRVADDQA